MHIDPEILMYLHRLQVKHLLPRDANDLMGFVQRYDAISSDLPGPPAPLKVSAGAFNLNVTACGEKTRIEARLYLPEGIVKPVLMAFFRGGGSVAGGLSTPGSVDAVLALTPLLKPDFNTASYIRCANSLTFSRDDAVRSWHGLLGGRWETWDERAVLLHSNQPIQRPPLVVVVAAEFDGAHDDAVALHDWLREAGARCEFYGAPGMVHDFARLQYASAAARRLLLEALDAFSVLAELKAPDDVAVA